ncbi:unnamed protein product (mitochondrion) [Plasmodiophora brassicae]|uniref:PAS domain-containing protein n=1 Tax=Plasmodiophora brassicae TaxID=37360 RepID=A0A0G4IT64_PLABS|nr:hypothetical protein PBRA_006531 [Plasmodiophora brassicae]SPQ94502.1 unnamed protein product [Plasmodiophora brassicae]
MADVDGDRAGAVKLGGDDGNLLDAVKRFGGNASALSYAMTLHANQSSLNALWVVAYALEVLQMCRFVLPVDTTDLVWSPTATVWLRQLCAIFGRVAIDGAVGEKNAPLLVSLVVVVIALVFILAIVRVDVGTSVPMQKVLRAVLVLVSTVLYAPFLEVLVASASNASSSSSASSGFNSVTALILAIVAGVSVVVLSPVDLRSTSIVSRCTQRVELAYLLLKTAFVIAGTVSSSSYFMVLVALGGPAAMTYVYMWILPDYSRRMTFVRGSLLWAQVWIGIVYAVAVAIDNPSSNGPVYMLLAGLPIVIGGAVVLITMRISQIEAVPVDRIQDAYEIDLKCRLVLQKAEKAAREAYQQWTLSKLNEDATEEEIFNLTSDRSVEEDTAAPFYAEAKSIMEAGLTKFPTSVYLQIRAAVLHFRFLDIKYVGYDHLGRAAALESAVDYDFLVYRTQRDSERVILESEANREVVDFNRYTAHLASGERYEESLTKSLTLFWGELRQPTPDTDLLRTLGEAISKDEHAARAAYKDMFRIHSRSVSSLRQFAKFLADLGHDPGSGQALEERASTLEKAEEARSHDQSFRSTLFSDRSAIVVISGDPRTLCQITNVNDAAEALFGLSRAALVGKQLDIIIPEPISRAHTAMVRRNVCEPRSRLLDRKRKIVVLKRNGLIADAAIYLKAFVENNGMALSYLGIVTAMNEEDAQMVVDGRDGLVTAVSQGALDLFGITKDKVDTRDIAIRSLMPDYDDRRAAFEADESFANDDSAGMDMKIVVNGVAMHVQMRFDPMPIGNGDVVDIVRIRYRRLQGVDDGAVSDPSWDASESDAKASNVGGTTVTSSPGGGTEFRSVPPDQESVTVDASGAGARGVSAVQKAVTADAARKAATVVSGTTGSSGTAASSSVSVLLTNLNRRGKTLDKTLFSFRRVYRLAVLVIMGIMTAVFVVQYTSFDNYNQYLSLLNAAVARRTNLMQIAYNAQSLMFMSQGIQLPFASEAIARSNLVNNAISLIQNDDYIHSSSSLGSAVLAAEASAAVELNTRVGSSSVVVRQLVHQACSYIAGKAQIAATTPLDQLGPGSELIFILMMNIRGDSSMLGMLNSTANGLSEEGKAALTLANEEFIIMAVVSLVLIMGILFTLLRPLVRSIERDEDQIIGFFLEIPVDKVAKLEKRFQDRLDQRSTDAADGDDLQDADEFNEATGVGPVGQATAGDRSRGEPGNPSDDHSSDEGVAGNKRTVEDEKKLDAQKNKKDDAAKRRLVSTGETISLRKAVMFVKMYFLVIVVAVYIAAVLGAIIYAPAPTELLDTGCNDLNFVGMRIVQTMLMMTSVRALGAGTGGPTANPFGYQFSDVVSEINVLDNHQRLFLFGFPGYTEPGILNRKYFAQSRMTVWIFDACSGWVTTNGVDYNGCRAFNHGMMTAGLQAAMRTVMMLIQQSAYHFDGIQKTYAAHAAQKQLPLGFYSLMTPAAINTTFQTSSFATSTVAVFQYLTLAMTNVGNVVKLLVNSQVAGLQSMQITLYALVMVSIVLSYAFVFEPLIRELDSNIKRTRSLLMLIPPDVMNQMKSLKEYVRRQLDR